MEYTLKLTPKQASSEDNIRRFLAEEKGVKCSSLWVRRRSIDARQRQVWVNLTVETDPDRDVFDIPPFQIRDVSSRPSVIVVGAGPAGLFAALRLIERGLRPVVLERGKDVRERKKDIARIRPEQRVNPESNYSFGEGGAGAYSDGKLYTRSKKRGDVTSVLRLFVQHGASPAILVDAHPHIGTDRLPRVIENIRESILRAGGEVHFQTRVERLLLSADDRVEGVVAAGREFRASAVILATGHSARDVYRYLVEAGVEVEAKGLAIGVRLEHPAHLIDQIMYHSREGRGPYLPAAEYSMVDQISGRGVYTFCMCPGGFVVPAATGPEQVVVNGMSPSGRNGRWSNSGVVVEMPPTDADPLSMLRQQEEIERLCWLQANRLQTAPAQRMADFVNGRLSADLNASSYAPGLVASPLHFWMPKDISERLREAFRLWGRRYHGFLTNEATVIAVETRTSSPVRILRDRDSLHHVRIRGLYPAGEGAGYAGGIVSAAIDGQRCADAICDNIFHITT